MSKLLRGLAAGWGAPRVLIPAWIPMWDQEVPKRAESHGQAALGSSLHTGRHVGKPPASKRLDTGEGRPYSGYASCQGTIGECSLSFGASGP